MGMSVSQKAWLIRGAIALFVLYIAFAGYISWAMKQPPETFARVMSRMPGPAAFLLFPFETVWTRARAGELGPGDPAPAGGPLKPGFGLSGDVDTSQTKFN
jgi:hypothetical protein